MKSRKRYLFYFGHPAKFHQFRRTINELKARGDFVDICINTKDMLEDLVKEEGWEYTNLFPNGRRIKGLHTYINAAVNSFITIYKLLKYISGKKYDLFITSDFLTFVGRIKSTPTLYFTDDDISAVPESSILIFSANYVVAPNISDLWKFNYKKIGYDGYKSMAHLHTNTFVPNKAILPDIYTDGKPLFFIRCVSVTSTHDVGKRGLGDDTLIQIVKKLSECGNIIINTQREIPEILRKYILPIDKRNVAQYIYNATLFLGDSNSMCYEAAVLGTPAIEIDDWFGDFTQYHELHNKYNLMFGYKSDNFHEIITKIDEILNNIKDDKLYYKKKRDILMQEKIDLSEFMIWLIKNYPESIKEYFQNPLIQRRFVSEQIKKY